jgi:hypothetical protein
MVGISLKFEESDLASHQKILSSKNIHIRSFLNGLAKQGMGIPIGKLSLVRIRVHVFALFWY